MEAPVGKPADPPSVLTAAEQPLVAGPGTRADTGMSLSAAQAAVDVARGQVAERRYRDARETLAPVLERLEQLDRRSQPVWRVSDATRRQLVIVAASAHSLLGRCLEKEREAGPRADDLRAQDAFDTAAKLFHVAATSGQLSARDWADYGEALAALGREEDAVRALSQARVLGFRSAEGLRHLGALYLRAGRLEEAEIVLSEGVELTNRDWEAPMLLALVKQQDPTRADAAAEMFVEAGRRASAAGRLEDSLSAYQRAAELRPHDPALFEAIGKLYLSLGRPAPADVALTQALELAPSDAGVLGLRGRARVQLGRVDLSIEDLSHARTLDPELDWAAADLASVHRYAGNLDEARRVLDEALPKMPHSVALLTAQAELLWVAGDLNEALAAVNAALEQCPNGSRQLALKGGLLRSLGRPRKALAAIERALENAAGLFPWAQATKGQTLRALGRHEEARSALELAVHQDPDLAWAREELARLLLEAGDADAALAELERLGGGAANGGSSLTLRAQILLALDRHDEARQAATEAVELEDDNVAAHLVLAELLDAAGDHEAALQEVDRAMVYRRDIPDPHSLRARILLGTGRYDEGLDELRRCAELEPDSVERVQQLVSVLRRRGRFDEARARLERALERTPESAPLLRSLGYVQLDLGLIDDAASTFALALAIEPDSAAARADVAFAQERRGSCRAALHALLPALEVGHDDPWTLIVYGMVLADMGEFRDALEPLRRSVEVAPALLSQLSHHVLASTLENLGSDYETEAHAAYLRAYELDPGNLFSLLGVAKTRPLSEGDIAASEYEEIIEGASELGPHPALVSALGWCNSCLGRHDEAMDLYVKAISLWPQVSPSAIGDLLALALAILASGRAELAVAEHERARRLSEALEPERRRGVLGVALANLDRALRHGRVPESGASERMRRELTEAFRALDATVRERREASGLYAPVAG